MSLRRMVAIELTTCLSVRIGGPWPSWTLGKGRFLALPGFGGGESRFFADQESVSGDAERGVVMESSPTSPFEMGKAEFAFQLLVVTFDAPAQFGGIDEDFERGVFRQSREPIFGRRFLALGPFDQQPFVRRRRCEFPIS